MPVPSLKGCGWGYHGHRGNAALVGIGGNCLGWLLVLPVGSQSPSARGSRGAVISDVLTALRYRSVEVLTLGLFQPQWFRDAKGMKIRRVIASFGLEETSGGL